MTAMTNRDRRLHAVSREARVASDDELPQNGSISPSQGANAQGAVAVLATTWSQVLAVVECDRTVSRATYASWLANSLLISVSPGSDGTVPVIVVGVSHRLAQNKVRQDCLGALEAAWTTVFGETVRVLVEVTGALRTANRDLSTATPVPDDRSAPATDAGSANRGDSNGSVAPQPTPRVITPDSQLEDTLRAVLDGPPIDARGLVGTSPNQRWRFTNFTSGPTCSFALAAARAVASAPGREYNPLTIVGPSGTGKSHLIGAIASVLLEDLGKDVGPVGSVSRDGDFASHGATPTSVHGTYFLINGYTIVSDLGLDGYDLGESSARARRWGRRALALLIDDLHVALASGPIPRAIATHLICGALDAGSQVVVTTRGSIGDLTQTDPELASRLGSGLVAPLPPPDHETRLAILRARATGVVPSLPDEALEHLAQRVGGSVRDLEGAFLRLRAAGTIGRPPQATDPAVRSVGPARLTSGDHGVARGGQVQHPGRTGEEPTNFAPRDPRRAVSPVASRVLAAISAVFGVDEAMLSGPGRSRDVTLARHAAMYVMREQLDMSLSEIARHLGRRDHTTVMHAVARIGSLRQDDPNLDQMITEVCWSLGSIRDG